MNRTAMDDVASILSEAVSTASPLARQALRKQMDDYSARYAYGLKSLLRIPGFRKLWDAMVEGCK